MSFSKHLTLYLNLRTLLQLSMSTVVLNINLVYRWKSYLEHLGGAGANSIRVWVHVEGDVSPQYDGNG
jgi:hypothetical protein